MKIAVGDVMCGLLRSSKDEDQLTSTLQHPMLPGQYEQFASGLQLEPVVQRLQNSQFNTETSSPP